MKTRTFVRDIPDLFNYCGSLHDLDPALDKIVIGGVTLRQYGAVMQEAQNAGFFAKVGGLPDYAIRDWMSRAGGNFLYVYTMASCETDEQIIGWVDNEVADFHTLADFVACAQAD